MAVATQIKSMDLLLFARAAEGLSHWRGIVVSFLALLLGGAVLLLGMNLTASSFSGAAMVVRFLFLLLCSFIVGTGVSAAGIMLLDNARNVSGRSLPDALVFGAICVIKLALVVLIALIVTLLFLTVAAMVYFICRVPGVGPLLLFFSHPVLVLAAGILIFSATLFFSLVSPALWDGDTTMQAIAKALAILKERYIVVVLHLVVMVLVTAFIMAVVAGIIVPGYFSMTGLAARIIGASIMNEINMPGLMDPTSILMTLMTLMSMGGQSGHMQAILLDTAVMAMMVGAMALQVYLMGMNLVYLNVSEGVDASGAEQVLKQQFDQAKAKAEVAKRRALEAADRARQAAQQARSSTPVSNATCPNCNAATSPGDAFCENCGHKLK
jgi:hypothetical protein